MKINISCNKLLRLDMKAIIVLKINRIEVESPFQFSCAIRVQPLWKQWTQWTQGTVFTPIFGP